MKKPNSPPNDQDREIARQLGRMTRRGFAVGGAAALAGFAGWKWIGTRSEDGLVRWPLRRVLEVDEKIGRAVFDRNRLSRSFPASWARMPRVNGKYGVDLKLDLDAWRLKVEGPSGSKVLTLADIKALPRHETTTELRCIEGWSEVVTWAGARFRDLVDLPGLFKVGDFCPYVSLTTPDRKYFVGLDIASALHPQTLLCYEMNGRPLERSHGAPLRLAIPVKYGIKNLKQVGTIRFTAIRPDDFWAAKGYDWYAGL